MYLIFFQYYIKYKKYAFLTILAYEVNSTLNLFKISFQTESSIKFVELFETNILLKKVSV